MVANSKKLASNIIFVYGRVIMIMLIGLLSTRYALEALGQSDYGLYGVVGGMVAILAIVCTAMCTTTRRFINVEAGKNGGNVNKIFNTCLIINLCFAILLFVLAETIGLFYIFNYLKVDRASFSTAIAVFNISTAASAISIIFVPYLSLLESHESFGRIAIIDVSANLLKLVAVYLLLSYSGNRLILYAIVLASTTLASQILYLCYCRKYWPETIKIKLYKDWSLYKKITIFNNYIALGAATYVARNQGSNMIVNFFFGTLVNGAMSIAYAIESYLMVIISNLTTASAPQITQSYSAGEVDTSVEIASKINRFSLMFMTTLVFIAYVELPTYLEIWLGEIPIGCLILCRCTLISAVVRALSEGLPPLIQATGKIKWFQICGSMLQLSVLPIGWLLFHLGYPPQSIIICFIITILINFNITLFIASRVIGRKYITTFLSSSLFPNLKILLVYVGYYVCYELFFKTINPVLNISISVILGVTMILFVGMKKSERENVFKLLHSRK